MRIDRIKNSLTEKQRPQRSEAATNPRRGFHRQATGSGAIAYPTTRKTFLSQSRQGAKRISRSVLSGEKCSLCVSAPWREIFFRILASWPGLRGDSPIQLQRNLSLTNACRPNSTSSRSQIWRRSDRESTGANPLLTGLSLNGQGKSCFPGKFL